MVKSWEMTYYEAGKKSEKKSSLNDFVLETQFGHQRKGTPGLILKRRRKLELGER